MLVVGVVSADDPVGSGTLTVSIRHPICITKNASDRLHNMDVQSYVTCVQVPNTEPAPSISEDSTPAWSDGSTKQTLFSVIFPVDCLTTCIDMIIVIRCLVVTFHDYLLVSSIMSGHERE